MTRGQEYYRHDGVRITHDPYAPGMSEKYGRPGKTDNEGFDPYADSVGPGIYGGVVKRDEAGEVVVGRQYQNHNPRPGPVYAGGGYTPVNSALKDHETLRQLLTKFPDLAVDVSTGGAQPLHMCGMSGRNQAAVGVLVEFGADIEAVDTYGYTPLHRMASNNLAEGARQLLAAGADPLGKGASGQTAFDVARSSAAKGVIDVLRAHGDARSTVDPAKITVLNAGLPDVNGEYTVMPSSQIPPGFDAVCRENSWDTNQMWRKLAGGRSWFRAENEAYIYWNLSDQKWWIDAPDGRGVYIVGGPDHAPPAQGWKSLGAYGAAPTVLTFRHSASAKDL